jgi:hypothetical protein
VQRRSDRIITIHPKKEARDLGKRAERPQTRIENTGSEAAEIDHILEKGAFPLKRG